MRKSMQRANLAAAMTLILVCTSALATETQQPASLVEPERSIVFDDTFQDGPLLTIARFIGSGDYSWPAGELYLKPPKDGVPKEIGLLYKAVAGPVADLTARIEFPPIENRRGIAETYLTFSLESGEAVRVAFVRKRMDDAITTEVRVIRASCTENVVRAFPLPGDAPPGEYTVRYHHGLVGIQCQGRLLGQAFVEVSPPSSSLRSVSISQKGLPVRFRQLRLAAVPRPEQNDSQKAMLLEAVLAGGRSAFLRAERQRAPDAERAAIESLVLFQKLRGREHADVACAFVKLAEVCEDQGKHQEAQRSYEAALKIMDKALGPPHPLTAATRLALGRMRLAQGEHAAAKTLFEVALPVYESVYGNNHPETETLYHLLQQVPPRP
ncbi:MAG: tetratricopeptide repeat protein [Planctomycetota bacterium]